MVLRHMRTRGALFAAVPVLALGVTCLGPLSPASAEKPGPSGAAAQIGQVQDAVRAKFGAGLERAAVIPPALPSQLGDWNGDRKADILTRDAVGKLWLYPGTGNGASPYRPRRAVGGGWGVYGALVRHGDFNFDGKQDILARDRAGVLWFYAGTGAASGAGHRPRVRVGGGWGAYPRLFGVSDWTADKLDDLVAVDGAGKLWLYEGKGGAALFKPRRQIGRSWQIWDAIVSIGDLSGDGGAELLTRARVRGNLFLYASTGNPARPYTSAELIGEQDWHNFNLFAGVGDLDGLGQPDLLARDVDGFLYLGSFESDSDEIEPVGRNWNIYNAIF